MTSKKKLSMASKNVEMLTKVLHEIEDAKNNPNSTINITMVEHMLKASMAISKIAMNEFRYRKESGYEDTTVPYYDRDE